MDFRDSAFIAGSKHFCLLPWLLAKVDKDRSVKPCCLMTESPVYGSLEEASLREIWNGEPVRAIRRGMLEDAPFAPCRSCYETEERGDTSFRQEVNLEFGDHGREFLRSTGDPLAPPSQDGPAMLDLRFSNLCNFRCRSCNPAESSAWSADAAAFGHVGPAVVRLSESFESVWSWIEPLLPSLRRIYLLGGEPLLIEDHYLLLERLIREGRTRIPLRYNTNLSKLGLRGRDILGLWNRFESVHVGISVDGVGAQAELLRKGTVWSEIVANFAALRERAPRVEHTIYPTVGVMNAFHLTTALDFWIGSGWIVRPSQFQVNFVHMPARFNIRILEEGERQALASAYDKYLSGLRGRIPDPLHDAVAGQLRSVLRFLTQGTLPAEERRKFRATTFKLDRLRGERFVSQFPELFGLLYGENPASAPR